MTVKISWLPNGHVVHGYRKVFVIHDSNDNLQGVITFAPIGYETVYQVKESAQFSEGRFPGFYGARFSRLIHRSDSLQQYHPGMKTL